MDTLGLLVRRLTEKGYLNLAQLVGEAVEEVKVETVDGNISNIGNVGNCPTEGIKTEPENQSGEEITSGGT